jgi:enoyl-CoA hydratase/carnithine racemase
MDGVALLQFCGQDTHNAIDAAMWRALDEAIGRCEQDEGIRAIVLTGAGHVAFATDVGDPALERGSQPQAGADDAAEAGRAACARLARCDKPIIARIRGDCVGAGLVVALHADLRIAAEDSDFALSGARARALEAEHVLVRAVGDTAARHLLLTGARIEAAEALRIGLVTRMVRDADLSDTVADLARLLTEQPAGSARAVKRALDAG